jgi:Fic family protein
VGKNGLVPNAGSFRKIQVKPGQGTYDYLNHDEIIGEMNRLFKITRKEMQVEIDSRINAEVDTARIIKIAAQFLNKFLFIHPYENGNGRVARLLVSYILLSVSIVPVSLTEGTRNDAYYTCLNDLHRIDGKETMEQTKPVALATFILERVFMALDYFCKACADNDDN